MPVKVLFVLVFWFSAIGLIAQNTLPRDASWDDIEEAKPAKALKLLKEKALYNFHFAGNQALVDSICEYALQVGVASENEDYYEDALAIFFEFVDLHIYFAQANSHIITLINSDRKEVKWLGYWYASKAYRFNYQPQEAYDFATIARDIAIGLDDQKKVGLSIMALGDAKEQLNDGNASNKYDALTHFLEARDVFLKAGYKLEELKTIVRIASFFDRAQAPRMAMDYINEAILVNKQADVNDTLLALDIVVLKSIILSGYNEEEFARIILPQIKNMRSRGLLKQNDDLLATYRTYLINNNKFAELNSLYHDDFPEEFELIKHSNLELYYRMRAYFSEIDSNYEEADSFWSLALEEINTSPNLYRKTNSYLRFAEYNMRINRLELAEVNYQMAWDTSVAARTDYFSIKAAAGLENLYKIRCDFEKALYWQEQKFEKQRITDQSNEKDVLKLAEVEQVAKARLNQMTFELNTQQKRLYLMVSGFAIFLGLAGINFYQYRQTRFQKERSDELLLNILPKETANELKEKGRTTALRYNNVTILFADIIGFSKVAETLEPGPLVDIIDSYFRAFDEICSVYGLEKIKTIGDAYVAVAGLPEGNLASPIDAVKAGLSMQRATEQLNQERGELPLKLRLGLNTGDVVAGVVGSLKFQFDIWGDAVNVAARMEQYGQAEKVNISEATYQLVKDQFECTPRGKIAAKNKGDLEMYFVEGPRT